MHKTILLAEDDHAIHEVVTIILEGEGYRVLHAMTEAEVFTSIKKEVPHLLLLDIGLGGSDGKNIAQQLKNNAETQSIPIVIVSANAETEAIAKESNADGFLAKPFELETLIAIAKKFIA